MIKTAVLNPAPAALLGHTLFLGSDDDADPGKKTATTPEQIKAVKELGSAIVTSVNSALDYLEEPLKGQFLKVKENINAMLAGMPVTDSVPAALESNYMLRSLMSVLTAAQSMMTSLTETSKNYKAQLIVAQNSLPSQLATGIDAKVKSGEIILKADHEAKVTAAVTAAKALWDSGIKLVGARKTLLTTASLPVPGEDILSIEEKDWTPKHTEAMQRQEKLKPFKLEGEIVTQLCWVAPADEFARTLKIIEATGTKIDPKEAAKKPRGGSPFQNTPAAAGTTDEIPLQRRVGCI
jgi:hypothetical protein